MLRTLGGFRGVLRLDGAGALLTAFLLGVVLVRFEPWFGMPRAVLWSLATIALGFASWSWVHAFRRRSDPRRALRVIAVANLLYCGLSAALVLVFLARLTALGVAWFVGEIVVVATLGLAELRMARPSRR
jgi:hypothetical protein